jgi:hypothetical protein
MIAFLVAHLLTLIVGILLRPPIVKVLKWVPFLRPWLETEQDRQIGALQADQVEKDRQIRDLHVEIRGLRSRLAPTLDDIKQFVEESFPGHMP